MTIKFMDAANACCCEHPLILWKFPRNRHICLLAHVKKRGPYWHTTSKRRPMYVLRDVFVFIQTVCPHVHSRDEQTWIKIQIFLPPEMYILRMYRIRTFCTFLVCTKELFLVCTNMYRTSKCWFKLHLYLFGWFILHEYFFIRAAFRIKVRYYRGKKLFPKDN